MWWWSRRRRRQKPTAHVFRLSAFVFSAPHFSWKQSVEKKYIFSTRLLDIIKFSIRFAFSPRKWFLFFQVVYGYWWSHLTFTPKIIYNTSNRKSSSFSFKCLNRVQIRSSETESEGNFIFDLTASYVSHFCQLCILDPTPSPCSVVAGHQTVQILLFTNLFSTIMN